jgi:hypothetical protein
MVTFSPVLAPSTGSIFRSSNSVESSFAAAD